MSLKHDPSAIRYASTQEAYGQLWTLYKVEPDGAQIWKNDKGQTAMVQTEPVDAWVFDGKDDTIHFDGNMVIHMCLSPVDLAIRARDAKRKQRTSVDNLKPSTIFGYYSQEAALAGCAVFTYRDERNAIHQLTRYEFDRTDKCHWPDCQFVGEFPIGNYVETIKQPTLAGQQVWWKNQTI